MLGFGSLAEQQQQQQQVTFMQKLQAERRRRLLEYQQRKRLEAGNALCSQVLLFLHCIRINQLYTEVDIEPFID